MKGSKVKKRTYFTRRITRRKEWKSVFLDVDVDIVVGAVENYMNCAYRVLYYVFAVSKYNFSLPTTTEPIVCCYDFYIKK